MTDTGGPKKWITKLTNPKPKGYENAPDQWSRNDYGYWMYEPTQEEILAKGGEQEYEDWFSRNILNPG